MSTRSTLGYMDADGKFRGTYIHHDGFCVDVAASARFKNEGYEALVEWIEAGIAGGGYSGINDAVPYGDVDAPGEPISAGDYFDSGWLEFAAVVIPEGVRMLEEHEFWRALCTKTYGTCVDLAFAELEPETTEERIRAYELVKVYVSRKWEAAPEVVRCVTERAQKMIDELRVGHAAASLRLCSDEAPATG